MTRKGNCPAHQTLLIIGGRWKVPILWHLAAGTCRFSQLQRSLGATPKVLTRQLRDMERDGLLRRRVYAHVPPHVEYSLTPMGKTLLPVVGSMCRWGQCRPRSR